MLWLCTDWEVDWNAIAAIATATGSLVAVSSVIFAWRAARASERAVDAAVKQSEAETMRESERRQRIVAGFSRILLSEAHILLIQFNHVKNTLLSGNELQINAAWELFIERSESHPVLDASLIEIGNFEAIEVDAILQVISSINGIEIVRQRMAQLGAGFDKEAIDVIIPFFEKFDAAVESLQNVLRRHISNLEADPEEP